jgi:release factor glutamine methyltransferase
MRCIRDVLLQDAALLQTALGLQTDGARIEVQVLLQRVLQVGRAYLFAHPEYVLSSAQADEYRALLQRRLVGEPVAYLFGDREFFGLNLSVTPATLIPRPDTELLVELALARISEFTLAHAGKETPRILDMGTGSGAIALAVAHERADAEVWACDASVAALAVARANAQRLGIVNVRFVESDWFAALGGQRFHLIVSNPPYIAADDPHLAQGDVRFEPLSALASGADGLDDIRAIITQAAAHLEPGGSLMLEHGYDQAERVRGLLQAAGFTAVFSARDLAEIERCSGGQLVGT